MVDVVSVMLVAEWCLPLLCLISITGISSSRTNSSQRNIRNSKKETKNTREQTITTLHISQANRLHPRPRMQKVGAVCSCVSCHFWTIYHHSQSLLPSLELNVPFTAIQQPPPPTPHTPRELRQRDRLSRLAIFVVFLSPSGKSGNINLNILLLCFSSIFKSPPSSQSKLRAIKRRSLLSSLPPSWIRPCLIWIITLLHATL
jgi:hypothetical protein